MYFVYVLRNHHGRLYVGYTTDLERRVQQHQLGEGGWTRVYGPWELVHYESFDDRAAAMHRERSLKSGQGRAWLREQLNGRAGPP